MASYLSDEWFDQVSRTPGEDGPAESELVLQHVIRDSPYGEVAYHVKVSGGTVAIVRGRAGGPDVTFAEDYATAAAIASGSLSAPAALLAGRIRVGGDMATLIAHQDVLAAADPVAISVRAATTF